MILGRKRKRRSGGSRSKAKGSAAARNLAARISEGASNMVGAVASIVDGMFGARSPRFVGRRCRKAVCNPDHGWSGRYHPKAHKITFSTGRNLDPEIEKAGVCHEHAHAATLSAECGVGVRGPVGTKRRAGVRKSENGCTYNGEHDARFYRHLAAIHRRVGTDPKAAREFERRSGYKPPKGWMS